MKGGVEIASKEARLIIFIGYSPILALIAAKPAVQ
jgi:hypothetical protein